MRSQIYYSQTMNFPMLTWDIKADLSRELAPKICEQLHAITHERYGATFYYTNVDSDEIICRYEWPRTWRGRKYSIHAGLVIRVNRTEISSIQAYVTTNDAIRDNAIQLPLFTTGFQSRIINEIIQTLDKAVEYLEPSAEHPNHVIFHLEVMPNAIFDSDIWTDDHRIKVFKTHLVEGKLVSAVSITVNAASNESGKPKALHDCMLFCALLTLACNSNCQTTTVKWGRRNKFQQFVDNPDLLKAENLYPAYQKPPFNKIIDPSEKVKLLWNIYHSLSKQDQEAFSTALFACYSAKGIHGKYSTVAVTAYIAALSSLAEEQKVKCKGELTCSICGPLSFKHDLTGDKSAILRLLQEILEVNSIQADMLKKTIDRVYNKQRSAFLHSAELRHEEFHSGYGLPASFPTETEPVRDVFYYRQDFLVLEDLTHMTLIKWLSAKTGISVDKEFPEIGELKLKRGPFYEGSVSLPGNAVVAPFQNGNPNNSNI